MTVVTLDKTTWTQINSAAQRIQVFGGRIRIAASGAPVGNDFQVWREGEVVDVTAVKYAQAVDGAPTWVVAMDV